jgi:uncharacterized membrane protein YfhO
MKKMEEGIAEIKTLPELKLSKFLIYIPIINFIFLSQKENNYRYHIRNGIILSFVFIVVLNLIIFDIISGRWLIMFLFPICF